MAHLVDELDLNEFDFFAWDSRGHGRSPGERGDSPSIGTSVRDIQTFIDHIGTQHGFAENRIVVIAQGCRSPTSKDQPSSTPAPYRRG